MDFLTKNFVNQLNYLYTYIVDCGDEIGLNDLSSLNTISNLYTIMFAPLEYIMVHKSKSIFFNRLT